MGAALAPARDPVYEDGFLEHSDGLFQFVDSVRSGWNPEWGEFPEDIDQQLLASIGDGLLSFLVKEPEKRLLVKNPRPDHLGKQRQTLQIVHHEAQLNKVIRFRRLPGAL